MIEPYWMAFFNLIISSTLLAGFLTFRHLFPKKKINYLLLLVLISILPIISVFRTGVYESGDFVYHIYRAMSFYDALKDGVLIPSWAGNLNSTYGYPAFIFLYNIPYYLFAFFHSFGFTFIFSERLILSLSFIFSGIFMYFAIKKLTNNQLASFVGAIVYLFSPYHLVDLHFRVSIGEVIAFALVPLVFYLILKLEENKKLIYFALLTLLLGILFLAHPDQFVYYSGLFFVFILYQWLFVKKKVLSLLLIFLTADIIGLLISSYDWISRFTLSQYTYSSILLKTPVTFVQPLEFLVSSWRLGFLFQGPRGELSFVLGYTQLFILILAICILIKYQLSNSNQKQLLFWAGISLILIFLIFPFSKPIWDLFPLLHLTQFTYRILHPLIFCISIITAYAVLRFRNKRTLIFIFVVLTIGYTLLNWGNRRMIPSINDQWIRNNLPYSTAQGEGNGEAHTIWWNSTTEPWIREIPKNHLEFITGGGEIKEIKRTSVDHEYILYANTTSQLLENTFYFPDWTISVDSKPVTIYYTTAKYRARMVFNVSKGLHYIQVKYSDIPIMIFAKKISITIILIILTYIISYSILKIKTRLKL